MQDETKKAQRTSRKAGRHEQLNNGRRRANERQKTRKDDVKKEWRRGGVTNERMSRIIEQSRSGRTEE